VDRDYRRQGIARVALDGALHLIALAGGGVVESYPQDTDGKRTSASFLYNATRSLFEQAGLYLHPAQGNTPFRDAQDGSREEGAGEAMSASAAAESQIGSQTMDMLMGAQIAEAKLTDWRKLAQGLHARYVVADFGTGARFVAAVGEAGDALGHHPSVSIGNGYVDLKLVSADAIYRDDEGTEHVVEWVTQQDVDLARRITEIAADHKVDADPASVSMIELGLDTAHSATIAPVWAALLTGNPEAQGHGSPSDEIRDAMGRVPNLWFGDADEHETPRQRFHVEVYVAPEVAEQRIAAALAAGGTVVDDSDAPALTVIADQDGNRGVLCVDTSAATKD
jgi:4a-hydroxytetrahydrobiopterin dehydratase